MRAVPPWLLMLTGALAACGSELPAQVETPVPPTVGVVPSPPESGAKDEPPPPPGQTPEPTAAADDKTKTIATFGVEITIPKRANTGVDPNGRLDLALSWNESGTLERNTSSPPQTLKDASALWDARDFGRNKLVIDEGASNKVFYTVRSFEVRVGVPGGIRGQHIHRWQRVSRIYGILPLDSTSYAECTIALEYGHDITKDHPGVQGALGICASMRRTE